MYLHRKTGQQLRRRSYILDSTQRNSGRFRTDRCAHDDGYLPSNTLERHFCRSTKHIFSMNFILACFIGFGHFFLSGHINIIV